MNNTLDNITNAYNQVRRYISPNIRTIIVSRYIWEALKDMVFENIESRYYSNLTQENRLLGEFMNNQTLFDIPVFSTDADIGVIFIPKGETAFLLTTPIVELDNYKRFSNTVTSWDSENTPATWEWGPTVDVKAGQEARQLGKVQSLENLKKEFGVEYKEESPPKKETLTGINNRKLRL